MGILKIKNLIHDYIDEEEDSKFRAIDNVSFDVEAGQFITILGHNGSGKSSLAKHINALLMPTEGSVWIDGIETTNEERVLDIRQTAGMVFQNPDNQIVATMVEEDVAFGPENIQVPTAEIWKRVERALGSVNMTRFRHKSPLKLSGGQKQRAAVARALITNPQIILADEPTGALDSKSTDQLLELFSKINGRGQTILMVTHSTKAASKAGRVLFIKDGEVFHQIYKASMTDEEMYTKISDTLTVLATGGESLE